MTFELRIDVPRREPRKRRLARRVGLGLTLFLIGSHAVADEFVVLESRWVRLAELPTGSWCEDAGTVLTRSAAPGSVAFAVTKRGVDVTGAVERRPARRRLEVSPKPLAPARSDVIWETDSIRTAELARGVDVYLPVARPDGGALVVRLQRDWRGLVMGPLTALEIQLDGESLYWVDANYDGVLTADDRVIYGDRSIWMPFHQPWIAGQTVYDRVVLEQGEVRAQTRVQKVDGETGQIFAEWNRVRKDQGVPPGLLETTFSQYCVEHSEYLRLNAAFSHQQDPALPGASEGGAQAGASSVIYLGDRSITVSWALSSAYHRAQILDPRDVYLQAGGNRHAFLMGGAWFSTKKKEKRRPAQAQRLPAPGSIMPKGRCSIEWPDNPAKRKGEAIGLPVFCRIFERGPVLESVSGALYFVKGSLESGERRGEVPALLSYPGHEAPREFLDNFDQVMLTPFASLRPGVYEADFSFVYRDRVRAHRWRFQVLP